MQITVLHHGSFESGMASVIKGVGEGTRTCSARVEGQILTGLLVGRFDNLRYFEAKIGKFHLSEEEHCSANGGDQEEAKHNAGGRGNVPR